MATTTSIAEFIEKGLEATKMSTVSKPSMLINGEVSFKVNEQG